MIITDHIFILFQWLGQSKSFLIKLQSRSRGCVASKVMYLFYLSGRWCIIEKLEVKLGRFFWGLTFKFKMQQSTSSAQLQKLHPIQLNSSRLWIFFCEINKISCDRKFISCDRNKKEHLVSQYTFPVNERIFTVTGNEYPVTGRTTNTSSHMKNISWHRRYTSCDRLNRLHSCHKK